MGLIGLARLLIEEVPHVHTFNPNVPNDLATVLMKMLEKDRNQNYQSAADVLPALQACRDAP